MANRVTKGDELECRVARLLFAEGAFVRRAVDLQVFYGEKFTVTDLDILALDLSPTLVETTTIGECKTSETRTAPNAADRLLWGAGLRALVQADDNFLVTTKAAKERGRRLAEQLGGELLDERDIARRERLVGLTADSPYGPHDPSLVTLERDIFGDAKNDQELRRVYWFVRSEFWFLDAVLGLKRALGACRLLGRRFDPSLPPEEIRAITWLAHEATVTVAVGLTRLAAECYRQPEQFFEEQLLERLSEGLAPYHVLEAISHEVDRYLMSVLSEAGIDPARQVASLGALAPRPPSYAEPLLELVSRLAAEPHATRDLARLLDWHVAEAALGDKLAAKNHFRLEDDTSRLLRTLAAFLAGQTKMPNALLQPVGTMSRPGPAAPDASGKDPGAAAGEDEGEVLFEDEVDDSADQQSRLAPGSTGR